ncbi:toxin-antitoxin system, toxin component [Streptomyces sp. NPDC001502]|uniref:toxin-antitoxin system, toxin component n=1 Tax=Streptomyces sp. NPDC001502 TaxID=3364578 RepID=UPI0036CE2A0A
MFRQQGMRKSVSGLVLGVRHLEAPVTSELLCLTLCEVMGKRRKRPIEFRTTPFPPGTASGLALNLGDRDLIVVERKTAPEHQVIITGHELRHLELGHCHRTVAEGTAAARLLRHDADLEGVVSSVLAIAGRQSPSLTGQDGAGVKNAQEQEDSAELFGLELAHRVRHLLVTKGVDAPDRGTTKGRIAAALSYHNIGS